VWKGKKLTVSQTGMGIFLSDLGLYSSADIGTTRELVYDYD
jgi:hypothetical protein